MEDKLTVEDLRKAYEALKKANVSEPYYYINSNGKGLVTEDGRVVGNFSE